MEEKRVTSRFLPWPFGGDTEVLLTDAGNAEAIGSWWKMIILALNMLHLRCP